MTYTHRYNDNILTINQMSDKLIVELRTNSELLKHVEAPLLDDKDFKQYQRIIYTYNDDVSYFIEQAETNILIKILHKSDVLVDAIFAVDITLCIVGTLQTIPIEDRDDVMLQVLQALKKDKEESNDSNLYDFEQRLEAVSKSTERVINKFT